MLNEVGKLVHFRAAANGKWYVPETIEDKLGRLRIPTTEGELMEHIMECIDIAYGFGLDLDEHVILPPYDSVECVSVG